MNQLAFRDVLRPDGFAFFPVPSLALRRSASLRSITLSCFCGARLPFPAFNLGFHQLRKGIVVTVAIIGGIEGAGPRFDDMSGKFQHFVIELDVRDGFEDGILCEPRNRNSAWLRRAPCRSGG